MILVVYTIVQQDSRRTKNKTAFALLAFGCCRGYSTLGRRQEELQTQQEEQVAALEEVLY
jgi:hypothetical protein